MCSRFIALRLGSLLLFTLSLLLSTPARADEEPGVEEAIQEGIALRRAGNDEAALSLFLELERKSPDAVRVLLHVTAAAQATGRWVMASDYLEKAASFKNDPYYVRNRAAIKGVEDTVARHVARFRVLGQPSGAEVRLSGNLIGRLPFKEPVKVELGAYVLEVSKPGYYALRRDITLNTGGTLTQEVVQLALNEQPRTASELARGPVAPSAPAAPSAPPTASDRSPTGWWESRAVTWTLAGIALAGVGTSAVAVAVREQKIDRWNDDTLCLDRDQVTRSREEVCGSERDAANVAGTVAIAGGVVAAIFATASLTHWLTTSPSPTREARRAPQASCGLGLGNVVCTGTF